jgi:two-component system, sensor histidine kinase and response regulator
VDAVVGRPAREELLPQAARLRTILESSRQLIFLLDRDARIVELSRLAREKTPLLCGRELAPGDPFRVDDAVAANGTSDDPVGRALAGEDVTVECGLRRPGGALAWYAFDYNPVRSESGEILGVCVGGTDITARRVFEGALRCSEQRYRALYHHTPVMLHSIDPEGRIASVSDHWLEKLGYAREEVIGRKSTEFLTRQSQRLAREVVLPAFYRTGACRDVPYQFVARDGRLVDVLLSAVAERDAEGRVLRSLAVSVDVTERNQALQELARVRDEAVGAAEMKAEFLASMGHEIRTPLGGIIGATELLLESGLNAEQRGFVLMALQSARSLLGTVNDVLDISRMEAGRLELESILLEPRSVMEEAVELLAASAQGKGVELYCRFDGRIPDQVRGDPGRLRQVLTNLVGNAVKFTPSGEIEVRAELDRRRPEAVVIRFSVRDTGTGIPPEAAAQLFRSHGEGDRAVTRRFGGAGLGLAMCRQLVDLMEGEIGVESAPGRGSTFWFRIPLPVNTAHAGGDRRAGAGPRRVRVLASMPGEGALAALLEDLVNLGMEASGVRDTVAIVAELRRAVEEGRPFEVLCLDDRIAGGEGELPPSIAEMIDGSGLRLLWLGDFRGSSLPAPGKSSLRLTRPVRSRDLRRALQRFGVSGVERVRVGAGETGSGPR